MEKYNYDECRDKCILLIDHQNVMIWNNKKPQSLKKDWRRHVVWQINIYIILMQWGLLTRAFYYDSTRTDIYPMLFCYISWTPICSNSKKLLKTSTVILLLTMIRVLNSDTWAFQMQISSKRFCKSLSFWGRN